MAFKVGPMVVGVASMADFGGKEILQKVAFVAVHQMAETGHQKEASGAVAEMKVAFKTDLEKEIRQK